VYDPMKLKSRMILQEYYIPRPDPVTSHIKLTILLTLTVHHVSGYMLFIFPCQLICQVHKWTEFTRHKDPWSKNFLIKLIAAEEMLCFYKVQYWIHSSPPLNSILSQFILYGLWNSAVSYINYTSVLPKPGVGGGAWGHEKKSIFNATFR
jgi:hypothetical protein